MPRKRKYYPQTRIDTFEHRIAMRLFGYGIDSARDIFSFLQLTAENEKNILTDFTEIYQGLIDDYIDSGYTSINGKFESHYRVAPYAGMFGVKFCVHDMENDTFHTTRHDKQNLEITGILTLLKE